jgi:hypothetical protein
MITTTLEVTLYILIALGAQADQLEVDHNLPEGILGAMMQVESAGDPYAVGSAGEFGPMQILPSTAELISAKTGISVDAIMNDPFTNLAAAAWYLRDVIDWCGNEDIYRALAAYNSGRCGYEGSAHYVAAVRSAWTSECVHALSNDDGDAAVQEYNIDPLASVCWEGKCLHPYGDSNERARHNHRNNVTHSPPRKSSGPQPL